MPDVVEALEKRLLLRTPIPNMPHPVPDKPGPHDHAPRYVPPAPLTGQQRWPLLFDASHVRELRPDLVGLTPPPTPPPGPPANIIWTNRASTTTGGAGDTDGFGNVFGANANVARAVVDAVIADYDHMIGSFNYGDNSANYNLSLSMGGTGNGASAGLSSTLGGKPKSGSISMGSGGNGHGSGWFIDPTPFDNSEFEGAITNAFAGDAQASSPANGLGDFFTVVCAEMTHCMGQFGGSLPLWDALTTNTGVHDGATGVGELWVFRSAGIKHLMTSDNAGTGNFHAAIHTSESANSTSFGGDNYIGAEDQGNAFYEFSRRYLVDDTSSLMFKDAFAYSSINPADNGTFYAILQSNGQVVVRGDPNVTNNIVINVSGSNLTVSVDPSTDVPGTGSLPGAGNLPAWVSSFPLSSVTSIKVQAGNAGDTVDLENNGGKPTTITGGNGNDNIQLSASTRNLDFIQGFTDVFGGGGTDSETLNDSNNTFTDTYTVDLAEINRPFFGGMFYGADVENLSLICEQGLNTVNIPSTYSATSTFINNGGAADVVNVGQSSNGVQSIAGYLNIQNDPSFSVITVDDTGDTTARNATQDSVSGFGRITGLAPATIDYQYGDTNSIKVVMGNAFGDVLNIVSDGKPFTVSNADGDDFVNIGGAANGAQSIIATVLVTNPPLFTQLSVNDNGDTTGRTFTMDEAGGVGTLTGLAPAQISWHVADKESVAITAGSGADTFNLLRSSVPVSYNGNGSVDVVNIGNTTNGVQGILDDVSLNNPPSFNVVNVNDTGDTTARTITHDTVQIAGFPWGEISGMASGNIFYKYNDTSSLNLTTGGGNDTVNILRDGVTFNLSNSAGIGDTVNVGNNTTGMQEITGALTMVNPPSFDIITFNDAADTTGRNFTNTIVTIGTDPYGQVTGLAPATILYKVNDTSATTFMAGSGTDTANFVETATNPRNFPAVYRQSAGFDTVNVNADNVGSATVNFPDTERLGALNVGAGGVVNMLANGNHVLLTRNLSVNASGKIDMFDNDMILDYSGASQLAAVQALINAGRTNGTWLGNGMTSTTARNNASHNTTLGPMEATDFKAIYGGAALFDGEAIDTTAVLVKYTYYGDADFNGKVNFDDYVRTDSGFNNHKTGWVNGDFNGNGIVNFDDYVLIDLGFNTQGGTL